MQLTLFDEEQMTAMGADAYDEATKEYPTITGTPQAQMVERVGRKIATASGYDFAWEFRLLDAPDVVNAFCLPGGKVAVYSGMLRVADTEDQLAAVLGHEVAHATAKHSNERVSQAQISDVLLGGAGAALGLTELSDENKGLVISALAAGANLGVLRPYSRKQESEADEIGLEFMMRAGYDPYAAPKLWDEMAQMSGEQGPLATFLSTHPAPQERAARLRELIPQMQAKLESADAVVSRPAPAGR
jgi:predicted Zn-dependent protease